jgi:NlpC/P60 family putative phage cell wall peptidase
MTTRAQIVAEAHTWLGTPFAHQQCAKGIGADCVGLIKGVAQACGLYRGLELPPYLEQPDPDQMRMLLLLHLDPIAYRTRQPGDILHFRSELDGVARHLGLIVSIEPHFIIHAWRRKLIDKVTRTRIDAFWRIDGCYRLRGLED